LEAAGNLLSEQGMDAVTVRHVATRAGVAPAGVYSRFVDKAGLLDALLQEGFVALLHALQASTGPNARTRLARACGAYRHFALVHPERYRLMFGHKQGLTMSAAAFDRAQQAFTELVTRVSDAQDAGFLREGAAMLYAQQIWSALHGAVLFEIDGMGFTEDPSVVYAELVETLLRGLST